MAALIAAGFAALVKLWPFTETAVAAALEESIPGKVQIANFRRIYFPSPGCVAEGVVVTGSGVEGSPVLIMVQRLTVKTGFLDVFRNSVRSVRAEGLRVIVPPGTGINSGRGANGSGSSHRVVGTFVADGAVVEFERAQGERNPLLFRLSQLTLTQSGPDSPIGFKSVLLNPEPPGEITTEGQFGPWKAEDPGSTPLSGKYRFENARLDVFKGIGGILSSDGKFSGSLAQVKIEGIAAVPDFEVKRAGHRVPLRTRFDAVVNGINGDTSVSELEAQVEKTTITAHVNVRDQGKSGTKVTLIDARGQGRVEDLLRLFSTDRSPAMTGPIRFTAKVTMPSGNRSFLKNLAAVADFDVDGLHFSKPATQTGLDTLSARAQGIKIKDPGGAPAVAADLESHVVLKSGLATFSDLTLSAPGATARLNGTYNLNDERVKLDGTLETRSSLSHDTSGLKALLLKPLDPIFKKKSAGAEVGVSIGGTYDQPSFGIDLGGKKSQ